MYFEGQYIAFEGQEKKSIVVWVGKIVSVAITNYGVHFMDRVHRDYGGCWQLCKDLGSPGTPWLTNVVKESVICGVVWEACRNCTFHMGDNQWDAIHEKFREHE